MLLSSHVSALIAEDTSLDLLALVGLVCLIHVVEVVVVVPGLRTAWVILRKYEHEVICAQLDALLGVRDHILDLFE